MSLLVDELHLDPDKTLEEQGGWTQAQRDLCRELALGALIQLRNRGTTPLAPEDSDGLHQMMDFLTGTQLTGSYVPMLTEELGLDNADLRAPQWHKDEVAPDHGFTVAIIGAGMSGILAAYRLQQTGVGVIILDKNDAIGDVAREHLPRLSGRRLQPRVLLLLHAEARLAAISLEPGRLVGILQRMR
jgi:4-hydroxyacetophenone monooxygenase